MRNRRSSRCGLIDGRGTRLVSKAGFVVATLWLTSALAHPVSAITLGELQAGGGTIVSLDGSVQFSGWSVGPGSQIGLDYADREVTATQRGFVLEPLPCYAAPGDCALEHFDGGWGPADNDELQIAFTVEGVAADLVGLTLEGTSGIYDALIDEWMGQPIYPDDTTEVHAELEVGIDSATHDRLCPGPSCEGVDPFALTVAFGAQQFTLAQLFASVQTAMYVTEPGGTECPEGGCFGSTAAFHTLGVSAVLVPEPSPFVLVALGLAGLGLRPARSHRKECAT